jgi:hypothetical protein
VNLIPCSACGRHVKALALACPFCGTQCTSLTTLARAPRLAPARSLLQGKGAALTLATGVAFGLACTTKQETKPTPVSELSAFQSAPTSTAQVTATAENVQDASINGDSASRLGLGDIGAGATTGPDGLRLSMGAVYGAPPVREPGIGGDPKADAPSPQVKLTMLVGTTLSNVRARLSSCAKAGTAQLDRGGDKGAGLKGDWHAKFTLNREGKVVSMTEPTVHGLTPAVAKCFSTVFMAADFDTKQGPLIAEVRLEVQPGEPVKPMPLSKP